jgi:hypothetical protein
MNKSELFLIIVGTKWANLQLLKNYKGGIDKFQKVGIEV